MAFIIIRNEKIAIQYTLVDFIKELTWEIVDCGTQEGKQRYKEISTPRIPKRRAGEWKMSESFSFLSQDVGFLFKIYNERDRRLFAGFLAKVLGSGGAQKVAKLTGLDVKTVRRGKTDIIKGTEFNRSRIRRPRSGRPSKARADKRYVKEIQTLVEDDVAGDPMGGRKWVRRSLRWIGKKLQEKGINVSISTIRRTLKSFNISLKKNVKSKSIQSHPRRNEQFLHLNQLKHKFLDAGKPVVSVDTKKKELIGNFKNDGRTWRKEAYKVLDHDFPSLGVGKLVPFGIYDLDKNQGHVYCGMSFETSEFAVDYICRWWMEVGQKEYPNQTELLILCDSGGANGYRRRGWKHELQTKLSDRFGLTVTVCHYPSGASKWNPIERRLFSYISINWAGEPLTSYEKALGFIRSTTTEKGLKVEAQLVDKDYKKGLKVSVEQMNSLNIESHPVCPEWNYTIKPRQIRLLKPPISP